MFASQFATPDEQILDLIDSQVDVMGAAFSSMRKGCARVIYVNRPQTGRAGSFEIAEGVLDENGPVWTGTFARQDVAHQ